ncbi:hypothetical protein OH77DRAFT_271769 [Trametes cingulata]|nr:hypothetical protein OH77DRAFT_271769 [Trametes cingulata]
MLSIKMEPIIIIRLFSPALATMSSPSILGHTFSVIKNKPLQECGRTCNVALNGCDERFPWVHLTRRVSFHREQRQTLGAPISVRSFSGSVVPHRSIASLTIPRYFVMLCDHSGLPDQLPASRLQRLSLSLVRVGLGWGRITPEPGPSYTYQHTCHLDPVVLTVSQVVKKSHSLVDLHRRNDRELLQLCGSASVMTKVTVHTVPPF